MIDYTNFEEIVSTSTIYRECAKRLGLKNPGGPTNQRIRDRASQLGIDITHLTQRLSWDLVKDRRSFKKLLLAERGHQCEQCHNTEWQGVEIPIEMDHVNGDTTDNDPTNLRLLCPNCHALTPTWKAKNKKSYRRFNPLSA